MRSEYPEINATHQFIDNLLLQVVRDPTQFEVIVTCNLFGDIASDVGAAIIGGLGVAPSGNVNPGQVSLFEPVHGSAPNIAGQNVANPMGAILSAAMMLYHIDWPKEARAIENAVHEAIKEGKTTRDLGGNMGTKQVGDYIAEKLS
jgi:3-isopropylmalate dehydrogenase